MRIISMLMILNLHSMSGICYNGDTTFQVIDYFRESSSICAIHLFVLASGYFGIKWRLKSFLGLLFQILFYFWTILGFCYIIGLDVSILSNGWHLVYLPFTDGWWFITSCLLLYLIAPLLNKINDSLSILGRFIFFLVLYVISLKYNIESLGLFSLLYSIGFFLKHLKEDECKWMNYNRLYMGGYMLLTVSITMFCLYLSWKLDYSTLIIKGKLLGWAYSSPLIILQSICLFLIFVSLRFKSKVINNFAVSVLAVYLIHMHPCLKYYYYYFTESLYVTNHYIHYILLALFIPFCFFVCVEVDKIRILLFNNLYKIIGNIKK